MSRTVFSYADVNSRLVGINVGMPDAGDVGLLNSDVLQLEFAYDAAGRITRLKEGNGFAREYGYDDVSRLTSAIDFDTFPGGAVLREYTYSYNKVGERMEKSVTSYDPPPESTETEVYAWNSYGVLTSVTGGAVDREFGFDLAGNLESIAPVGGQPLSFVYDKSGRVKQTSASDGAIIKYWYGPDERRVRRSVDADGDGTSEGVVRYFSDGPVSYEFDDSTGELQRAYVFLPDGYTPLMQVTFVADIVDKVYFYHNDHLSTPRVLTDGSGAPVWRARYAPFGSADTTTTSEFAAGGIGIDADPDGDETDVYQPLRFPGQWDDGISGVWYNWHRFYFPGYGIYGRRDPLMQAGSSDFGYVRANPTSLVDPKGLAWVYLWLFKNTATGHASLITDDGSTYISYYPGVWPFKDSWVSPEEDWCKHDDEDGKGNGPDLIYHIPEADDQKIGEWFESKTFLPWTISNECVDVVVDALEVGGLGALSQYMTDSAGLVWMPLELNDALKKFGYEPQEHPVKKIDCPCD